MVSRLRIRLAGMVQGVGFRPFVYRLANSLSLHGTVENSAAGLIVEVEGDDRLLHEFGRRVETEAPAPARILFRERTWMPACGHTQFCILESSTHQDPSVAVLPDLAPCIECRSEINDAAARRQGYPFTNCTLCGPRYTIVQDLPYDRPNTTMRGFSLCPDCRREYENPQDRRFHAQPIACPTCGPRLSVPLEKAAECLRQGGIVALKGVGGYQLLADACSSEAVTRLRDLKRREWKPLAVLIGTVDEVRGHADVSGTEAELLSSAAAPIVLLRRRTGSTVAPEVCGASPWLGVMLPASPLHLELLKRFPAPLVATSGNVSDEPIATDNDEAHARLGDVADLFVDHNRPVARPCDDSVARVLSGRTTVLRRARGYAPAPILLPRHAPRVLALGGHLKNSVAIGVGRQAIVSPHIGDLDSPESRTAFERAIEDLLRLYRFQPELVACDLHPDYYSTAWAESSGLPVIRVQHHVAHALSCLTENDARGPALAVCWDGTGYGTDGRIWGSEFFLVTDERIERVAHLRPFPLAGGDAAARDCARSAAGLQHRMGQPVDGPLGAVLARGTGCVETTSAGRLFDAVGFLTGLAPVNRYEGEAGLTLEAAAWRAGPTTGYPLNVNGDWTSLVERVIEDRRAGIAPDVISARFHHALADWVEVVAIQTGVEQVALSGGCFQNAFLVEAIATRLTLRGLRVLTHQGVPPNDGGISLGQLAMALRQAPP